MRKLYFAFYTELKKMFYKPRKVLPLQNSNVEKILPDLDKIPPGLLKLNTFRNKMASIKLFSDQEFLSFVLT